jgi:GNAT superfamily N-acetyltransferase
VEIPEHVRRQALHPFTELQLPAGWKRAEGEHVLVCFHNYPIAKIVEPRDLAPGDVDAAVEEARALVREAGKDLLVWWVEPSYEWLGPELERRGLVNEETPGFEPVENAMALVEPPLKEAPDDVAVTLVDSIDDLAASDRVTVEAFGMGAEGLDELDQNRAERYAEYVTPGNSARQFIAWLDGRVVGTAAAAIGDAGVNLFAAGVLPDARGRGVYRAMIAARWDLAVERGTPALTVQAGQMSRPVLESAGFAFIAAAKMYVDDLTLS